MSPPAQVAYWDRVAGEKTFGHPLDAALLGKLTGSGARILDLGCGYGRLAWSLVRAGFGRVVGIDASLEMARRARRARTVVAVAEGGRLPFASRTFDAALLFAVLTCVPEDAEQRAIVGELERVLRPGGALYASDLLLQGDARNRERYRAHAAAGGAHGTFALEGAVFRHHDPTWIEELLSGFERVERREVEVRTMNGNSARGFQWVGRKPGLAAGKRGP